MSSEPGGATPLGRLFNGVAKLYAEARPGYPREIFDLLQTECGLRPGSRVLEIGAGAGQATVDLLACGAHVTAVEPGEELAAVLRTRTERDRVEVIVSTFEEAEVPEASVDLVVAATAFHWVDPVAGIVKAAAVLRDGGWLAIWGTTFSDPDRPDPFRDELEPILEAKAPSLMQRGPGSDRSPGWLSQVEECAALGPVRHFVVRWETTQDAAQMRALFATFSQWLALPEDERDVLLDDVERLARERFGDRVVRPCRTVMQTAQRVPR